LCVALDISSSSAYSFSLLEGLAWEGILAVSAMGTAKFKIIMRFPVGWRLPYRFCGRDRIICKGVRLAKVQ